MRHAKWDANNGDTKQHADNEMREHEIPTTENKPDDIPDEAERASANIAATFQFLPIHQLIAEGLESILCNHEARPRPGKTDNTDDHKQCRDQPTNRREAAAKKYPKYVEQQPHTLNIGVPRRITN